LDEKFQCPPAEAAAGGDADKICATKTSATAIPKSRGTPFVFGKGTAFSIMYR